MDNFTYPMMSDLETFKLDTLIEELKPKHCLEWGAGGSTVYFPKKHGCIESWTSIEHDGKYVNYINNLVLEKVSVLHVPLDEYLSVVKGKKFDFILIDGLMRAECLMYAESLLNKGGVVILHDSSRAEYQKPIKRWSGGKQKLSEGEKIITSPAHRGLYKFWKHE